MHPRDKVAFLKGELQRLLTGLSKDAKGKWGVMNAQEMVEHLADFFDVSIGKIKFDVVTPEEHLPKYREFLYSDKLFRENTKAPSNILGENPHPLRQPSLEKAISYLQKSVSEFFNYFEQHPNGRTNHPVFGSLNFDEWVLLHYKHVNHHLRQFHP